MKTLLAAVLLVCLAACGSDSVPPVAQDSGIEGQVLLGPTCPVVTEDDPCPDQPAGGVEVRVRQGDSVVATTMSDAEGRFRVAAPPGVYDVDAEAGMFCKPQQVTVVAGSYASLALSCDTGIR